MRQLHDIAKSKWEHVPEVYFDQIKLECKHYKSYSFQQQKNIGSVSRQLAGQRTGIFIPSQIYGHDDMRMRYTAR